jgi:hypothetical protein
MAENWPKTAINPAVSGLELFLTKRTPEGIQLLVVAPVTLLVIGFLSFVIDREKRMVHPRDHKRRIQPSVQQASDGGELAENGNQSIFN